MFGKTQLHMQTNKSENWKMKEYHERKNIKYGKAFSSLAQFIHIENLFFKSECISQQQ